MVKARWWLIHPFKAPIEELAVIDWPASMSGGTGAICIDQYSNKICAFWTVTTPPRGRGASLPTRVNLGVCSILTWRLHSSPWVVHFA